MDSFWIFVGSFAASLRPPCGRPGAIAPEKGVQGDGTSPRDFWSLFMACRI